MTDYADHALKVLNIMNLQKYVQVFALITPFGQKKIRNVFAHLITSTSVDSVLDANSSNFLIQQFKDVNKNVLPVKFMT